MISYRSIGQEMFILIPSSMVWTDVPASILCKCYLPRVIESAIYIKSCRVSLSETQTSHGHLPLMFRETDTYSNTCSLKMSFVLVTRN